MGVTVKFWGVRGSVPTPLTSADLEKKYLGLLTDFAESKLPPDQFLTQVPRPFTIGGNTSCVEVRVDGTIIILDAGTGLRPLGAALFQQMLENKGLEINFLISHVHWDHINGLPFFGPLYANKHTGIFNSWNFFGGTSWQKTAELCLAGQMDPPRFPISWREIEAITHSIKFHDVHDLMNATLGKTDQVKAVFSKLNHPQETYGVRLETPHGVIVYTTDNEPYDPRHPDLRLVKLAREADLWVTDCQYSQDQYNGREPGPARHGWGHSYPEAVAETAIQAGVKKVVLFHHDPASSDERIAYLSARAQHLVASRTNGREIEIIPAWEGLTLEL